MLSLLQKREVEAPWDTSGIHPLYIACSFLQMGTADVLLRWGADERAADSSGISAEG